MIDTQISRFSKPQTKNRILLRLTTIGFSLGVIGTLSSYSAFQTFSRTPLTKAFNKRLLTSNSQGLKATVPPVVATVAGIGGTIATWFGVGYDISNTLRDSAEFNSRLDKINNKLANIESNTRELAAIAEKTNQLIKENNEILNDIYKLLEKL